MIQSVFLSIFQAVVVLGVSPFVIGLIRKVKARLQCRQGPGLLQPYYDLVKLFQN